MRKIINISIFAIAGLAVLLVVLFGFGFNQETQDKFSNATEVKANNPQMLTDLANATVETLPDFIAKYEDNITTQNTELKKDKLQCNIFYTFIYNLSEIVNQETLDNFKSKFPEYSQSMFASATDKNYFINGFNKVKDYSDFQSYYTNLKTDYNVVHQNYLVKASAVKAEMTLLKQIGDINAAVSITKKQYDLTELQKSVKTYKTEATQFNITMNLFYLLFFATFAAMIIFLLWNVIINIKSNFGLLAGVGLLVLLLILGYLFSTSELSPSAIKEQLDSNNVKWIGAGLFTFYCIFFGTIAAIVLSIILNAIKKVK
jgi:NADH:ubiquinone oxidoreductase subunit 3 (subunit A)